MNSTKTVDLPALTFLISAAFSGIFFILIAGFLLWTAFPVLSREGLGFFIGTVWDYNSNTYGIFYLIIGTLVTTALTLMIAVPIGVGTAVYLAEWAPVRVRQVMKTMIELLVGIPSVVYGIFGFFILRGLFRDYVDPAIGSVGGFIPFFRNIYPNSGLTILLAAVILSCMIIPIIVALSFDAMRAVPNEIKEASYAMGATKWDTIKRIVIPSAFTGIVTATVLGMMRAMGETMAVIMISGASAHLPVSILDDALLMTSKILNDIPDYMASGEPRSAIFAIGVALFLMEILFVALIRIISSHYGDKTT